MTGAGSFRCLAVETEGTVCRIRIDQPQLGNTITAALVAEFGDVLRWCRSHATVVVVEGLPEVFCAGLDFRALADDAEPAIDAAAMYAVWLELAQGPFVSVAHVRGQVNAGGVGFVAACDLVLADHSARFSLSELLFGLMPACVLPFLSARVGRSRANYMTLSTQPITAERAAEWGLVDALDQDGENLLRLHLLRLRRLGKVGVTRYKRYDAEIHDRLSGASAAAVAANESVFQDPRNLAGVRRYVETGRFPWEP